MLVHTVIFWLKKDLTEDEKVIFTNEVKTLGEISSVENFHLGTPAPTPKRPVVEDSYDYAITVVLKIWKLMTTIRLTQYIWNLSINVRTWERVVIYDAD